MSVMSVFARTIFENKYAHTKSSGYKESWDETCERVVGSVVTPYLPELTPKLIRLMKERKFIPGGRYLYAAGRRYQQFNSCFLLSAEDSREGWSELISHCTNALMTGGGIGVVYSKLRAEGVSIGGLGGKSTGPCALMNMVNECGRYIVQGGSRRSAIWAGLHWNHPDIMKFIRLKNWDDYTKGGKSLDFNFPASMDGTNISVILDDAFFSAFSDPSSLDHSLAQSVYWTCVRSMMQTGEPGFSVDVGSNTGHNLRNACTEVTSDTNLDMCNLLSLIMPRFDSVEEFAEAVNLCTAFLICGTLASQLPVPEMYKVREKNRRLGLGLMGVHEWILQRGMRYERSNQLGSWMEAYSLSGAFAEHWANKLGISRPVATRSLAPTGTISIIGETTSGIEPIFAAAYRRRYLDGKVWKAQYVVDATAKRIVDGGIDPELIEDAMTLAEDVERRIKFQAWMQRYVDHGISSTINLPEWGSSSNNADRVNSFGTTLLSYLPKIRGMTTYPNGARDGQPLTRCPYNEAIGKVGVEFVDNSDLGCKSGVCGS